MIKFKIRNYILFYFYIILSPTLIIGQIKSIEFSRDRDNVFCLFENDSSVYNYNVDKHELYKLDFDGVFPIKLKIFSEMNMLAILTFDNKFIIYDFKNESVCTSFDRITSFHIFNNNLFLGTNEGEIFKVNGNDYNIELKYKISESPISALFFDRLNRLVFTGCADGTVQKIDLNKKLILKENKKTIGKINDICFDYKNKTVIVTTGFAFSVFDKNLNKINKSEKVTNNSSNLRVVKNKILIDEVDIAGSRSTLLFEFKNGDLNSGEQSDFIISTNDNIVLTLENNTRIVKGRFYKLDEMPPVFLIDPENIGKCLDSIYFSFDNIQTRKKIQLANVQKSNYQEIDLVSVKKFKEENKSINKEKLEIIPQFGFSAPLKKMLFSYDGKYIVGVAESPIIKIWDTKSNSIIKEIKLPEFNVLKAAVHPKHPYLIIMDRNYEIFLINLSTQSIINSFKYTDEKYNYSGDIDNTIEVKTSMNFNEYGTRLHIVNKDNENEFTFSNDNTSSSIQAYIEFDDLFKKEVERISCSTDWFLGMAQYKTQNSRILKTRYDTTFTYKFSGGKYSIVINDGIRQFFDGNRYYPFESNKYYEDKELTKPLNSEGGEILNDFYMRLDKPSVTQKSVYLIKASMNHRYLLIKSEIENNIFLIENKTGKKLFELQSTDGEFINDKYTIYVNNSTLFNLDLGKSIELDFADSDLHYNYEFDQGKDELKYNNQITHVYRDNLIRIWKNNFDHKYLEYDILSDKIKVISIKKPLLGSIKATIDNSSTFINYKDFFSRLNFINLNFKDYYLLNSDTLNNDFLDNVYLVNYPVKNKFSLSFNWSQKSFTSIYSGDEFSMYSINNYFEILLTDKATSKTKRYMYNPLRNILQIRKCKVIGEACETYDCEWICEDPFSIYDSLQKKNYFLPKLTSKERLVYCNVYRKNRKYDKDGVGRIHGRGSEHTYLHYYNIPFELNDTKFHERIDLSDSLLIMDMDIKYALRLYSTISGKLIKRFTAPTVGSFFYNFIYNESKVASYAYDGSIRIYEIKGKDEDPLYTFY
ncbi:MAG: hypothetical protein ACK5D5_12470, partial [Bacteroidota bacterium]